MTFINHGAGGAAIYLIIVRVMCALTSARKETMLVLFGVFGTLGFILGMAPDVLDWAYAMMLGTGQGGAVKMETHAGETSRIMSWTLAWGLHVFLDRFIHRPMLALDHPYHDLIWMVWEIGTWLVYGAAIWFVFRWAREYEDRRATHAGSSVRVGMSQK